MGKIGPHEGKEFELFEKGEKNLIYFCWDWQPDNHEEIAKKLGAEKLTFKDKVFEKDSFIYYRKGMSDKAEELKNILCSGMHIEQKNWEENEYKIGELLGYSKSDVSAFIAKFRENYKKKH